MGCPLPNGGRPRHTNRKIGGCIDAHNNCTGFTVCLIGSDTVDAKYFLVFTCFLTALKFLCIREPLIIYVEEGRGKKRTGGDQGFFILARGGEGRNFFVKKFRGVSSLISRYILRGVHWQKWVKQLNSRAQTIYGKQ